MFLSQRQSVAVITESLLLIGNFASSGRRQLEAGTVDLNNNYDYIVTIQLWIMIIIIIQLNVKK